MKLQKAYTMVLFAFASLMLMGTQMTRMPVVQLGKATLEELYSEQGYFSLEREPIKLVRKYIYYEGNYEKALRYMDRVTNPAMDSETLKRFHYYRGYIHYAYYMHGGKPEDFAGATTNFLFSLRSDHGYYCGHSGLLLALLGEEMLTNANDTNAIYRMIGYVQTVLRETPRSPYANDAALMLAIFYHRLGKEEHAIHYFLKVKRGGYADETIYWRGMKKVVPKDVAVDEAMKEAGIPIIDDVNAAVDPLEDMDFSDIDDPPADND